MFDERFDETRKLIAHIQSEVDQHGLALNAANPSNGGPGLNAVETHRLLGYCVANVHNLAMALGNIIDVLDERGDSPRTEAS